MKRLPVEDLEHIYQNTQDIWESFRGKSIFVTGGTGFFGKWLLESFIYINEKLALNAKITTLTRNPEVFLMEYPFYKEHTNTVQFVKGDILTYDFDLNKKVHFIIHAATDTDSKLHIENPTLIIDSITEGTKRVLNFAQKNSVSSFLHISSGAVYGKVPKNFIKVKENQGFYININDSRNAYAEGKRISELLCSIYHEKFDLPIKITRCFAFVGPYLPLDKHFAIGNFISNSIKKEDIIIKGNGSPIRSYMYMSDLIIWLFTILVKGADNRPYNVGSDEYYDLEQVANFVQSQSAESINVKILSKSKDEFQERYVPDITLANNELSLAILVNLKNAINKTIKFNLNTI